MGGISGIIGMGGVKNILPFPFTSFSILKITPIKVHHFVLVYI